MSFASGLKLRVRHAPWWIAMRRARHLGWRDALTCRRLTSRILDSRPVMTREVGEQSSAACEVHLLTYNADWMTALWAAKSFYHYAQVDYPMVWHEGGILSPRNRAQLLRHFPQSRVVTRQEAAARVEKHLLDGGFTRCLDARRRSVLMMKLLDCLVLSRAERLLLLDSDVLFFRQPTELIDAVMNKAEVNLFNREASGKSFYNVTPQAAKRDFNIEMVEALNTGVGLVRRASLKLEMIEEFLINPDLLSTPWLAEQTLQAMCSSRVGVRLLPSVYLVSNTPTPEMMNADGQKIVSKHYSGGGHKLLCEEGVTQLIRQGLLRELSSSQREA